MQAPGAGFYTVTVTGVVGGMLPPKPGDLLMNTSPVYAQIFINHNGKCCIAFFVLIGIDSSAWGFNIFVLLHVLYGASRSLYTVTYVFCIDKWKPYREMQ
jgi:hypothetical protein